ncbi:Uncharacterised protein [Shigella sonnei]|nr:Uncharacterised protein [Shigella sonnei]
MFRYLHLPRQQSIGEHRRQAFIITANQNPALLFNIFKLRPFQMLQRKITEQFYRHIAVFQHQRFPFHKTNATGEVDLLVDLNP